jgi:hypothetical protein
MNETLKNVTLMFITNMGKRWCLTRDFNNEEHLRNFINRIERTLNYTFDEIYY